MRGPLVLWYSDGTAWVRVIGNGNFMIATEMKDFFKDSLSKGYRDFAIDLAECPVIDSTFMGILAFAALRLVEFQREGKKVGKVHVLNCNEGNLKLLKDLGLDQLFGM